MTSTLKPEEPFFMPEATHHLEANSHSARRSLPAEATCWRAWTGPPVPDVDFELLKKSLAGVIPAKAGIQKARATPQPPHWIPAFAGMTRGI